MTAELIPLIGLVGGGIDLSRMYMLKTRLQHACDAGSLAGRRAMGGGTWSYNNGYARTQANQFFDSNIRSDALGASGMTHDFTESAGTVHGTATATLPMTLMRVFGRTDETLSVSCESEMRLPNTDVMFVLDTTGSMGSVPAGDSQTKLASLKTSVKCFYEIVARLDTDAACTTGTPSGGTGSQVQIRFGFVPYAVNVNVGKLLPTEWFVDSATYQTREALRSNGGFAGWRYAALPVNVSLLKNGEAWNGSFRWPIGNNGGNVTIGWDGCIEERQTVSQSSYLPIPGGAKDLDLDSAPVPGDPTTQWRPLLPRLIYTRSDSNGWTLDTIETRDDMGRNASTSCPREARKLQSWPNADAFDTYVDSLAAGGQTYHDIGLIWGARLMSPTGLFAAENAFTPQGGEIERHMIFMTDGDPCADVENYGAYGVNWYDRRTTDPSVAPTKGCTSTGTLVQQINARTEALCTTIKNKNITMWVITFGSVARATETRMINCASPGKYFSANNAAKLQSAFKSIADQISMLRLTQ